jgi:predicted aldo/keto reductase-like oxidoreductase
MKVPKFKVNVSDCNQCLPCPLYVGLNQKRSFKSSFYRHLHLDKIEIINKKFVWKLISS